MKWPQTLQTWLGPEASDSALGLLQAFGPLLSSSLWVLQPGLSLFWSSQEIGEWAQWMEHGHNWEALRQSLRETHE